MAAFRQGLNEAGYIEGRNVTIKYRWAELHYDRIPELAADLVRRKVTVIAANHRDSSTRSQSRDRSRYLIVFEMASDPVELGLSPASIARGATSPA